MEMKKGLFFKLDTDNPAHKMILDFFDNVDHRRGKRQRTKVLYEIIMHYITF